MTAADPANYKLLPTYTLGDAARYLGMPPSTLRSWALGRDYPTLGGTVHGAPVLDASSVPGGCMSFLGLVESHVLLTIRRAYGLTWPKIKEAAAFLRTLDPDPHFLARRDFFVEGKNLLVEHQGALVSLTERGQQVDWDLVQQFLKQVQFSDADPYAERFLAKRRGMNRTIVFDPTTNFGRPVLLGRGIAVDAIAARFAAGEAISYLAGDYGVTESEIEDAIRWSERTAA